MINNRQKRVIRLKKRNINIGEERKRKEYICIIAKKNYRITKEQLKSINIDILKIGGKNITKNYNISILIKPNKVLMNKGILVRMGKGKGKIKTNVFYLTTGKICILLTPKNKLINNKSIINKFINSFIKKYSFFSYKYLI